MQSQLLQSVLGLSALLAAASPLTAAKELDLDRIKPVPANEPIPVMDFFRLALMSGPTLNDAGTHVAAVITAAEDRRSLMVYDLEKKTIETVHGSGDKDVYAIAWLDNKRLVYSVGTLKLYEVGLFATEVGRLRQSYPLLQFCGAHVVSIREKNRLQPLVWIQSDLETGRRDIGVAAIYADLDTGPAISPPKTGGIPFDVGEARKSNTRHVAASYPLPKGGIGTRYVADKDGELAFGFTSRDGIETMHHYVDGKWEKCPVDLDEIEIIGSGNKPGEVAVRGPRQPDKPRALQFMDAATGQLGEVLLQDAGYDFNGWLYRDPLTHEIIGAAFERDGPHTVWFTENDRTVQKLVQKSFPGQVVRIIDRDRSGRRFLIGTFSDRQPVVYHWMDLEKRSMGLVKNSAPWIDPARMAPMQILKFKTRDGRKLDAYLTLPAGASKEHPAPLIVLPHGGPYARDMWGFDGEAQFLASRGYAVLQPNYRGSPGCDWMFPESDRWAFRKMHDDVTDATKAAIGLGLVDAGRVAIMGGSFGGYLAISGVVNEPTLYRCAITIAGVFDWEQMLRDTKYDQYDNPTYAWLKRKLGDPKIKQAEFDAISPVRHVDQIRAPVFVAHGKDDPVANIGQSRRLISELEKLHVPHEVMLAGREGHGMGHLQNRVELYTRIEAFLAKYLAPAAAAAAAGPP